MKTTSKILVATVLLGGVAAVAAPVLAQNAAQPQVQAEQARFEGPRGPGGHGGPGGPGHQGRGPGQHGPAQLLRNFDTNKDGTISAEEITAMLETYDTNKDGTLDLDEFGPLWAEVTNQMMVRSFQFLDRDGDATVTESELSQPIERFSQRMADRQNHDQGPGDRPGRADGWRPRH